METATSRFFKKLGYCFEKESGRAILVMNFQEYVFSEKLTYKEKGRDPVEQLRSSYCLIHTELVTNLQALICLGIVFEVTIIVGESLSDEIAQGFIATFNRYLSRQIRRISRIDKGRHATTPTSIDLEIICKLDSRLFINAPAGYELTKGGEKFLDILSLLVRLSTKTSLIPTPRYEWEVKGAGDRALARAQDCVRRSYWYLIESCGVNQNLLTMKPC